jgi:branched-chain amino acid transport system substrate-binding protein
MVAAMWTTEAIRNAQKIHNTKNVTGEMVRDGYESLSVDADRLAELGMKGFTYAVQITCNNHEGPGRAAVQQWDAKKKEWKIVSKFYDPLRDITGPLIEEDSAAFAKENNITPRDC